MATNTVQSKSNNANIAIEARVSQFTTYNNVSSIGNQQQNSSQVSQGMLSPGIYTLSTRQLQAKGLNIAVEQFSEPRPARKAVQQTLEGIFVDTFDVAPPMLTILYAVEMPQATNLTNLNFFSPANVASAQVSSTNPTSAQISQYVTNAKASSQFFNNFSFVDMLNTLYLASSQRDTPNVVTVYFRDYTRKVHHLISILNVAYRASIEEQNILIVQVDAVVIQADLALNNSYSATAPATVPVIPTGPSPIISPTFPS